MAFFVVLGTTSCKKRVSSVKGIDSSLKGLLDLNTVTDAKALRDLCFQDSVILFIGNAEKLGRIVVNPLSKEPFHAEHLKLIEQNDAAKERWYFNKVQQEYAALKQKLSEDDPACRGIDVTSKGTLLAIIDGPGVGDSIIEVTSFERNSFDKKHEYTSQRMGFDAKTQKLMPWNHGQTFELLMPRDVPRIITAFNDTSTTKSPYWFGLKIIKGHGVTVRPGGDIGLKDVLVHLRILDGDEYPVTMLDSQDENGFIAGNSAHSYKIPMWSPEALCREAYGTLAVEPYKACVRDTLARLSQGFQVSSIGGCNQSRFDRLAQAQGDEKQGDEKQGDEKQGDEKQGDEKQGDEKQGDEKQGDEKQGDEKQGDEKQGDEKQGDEKQGDEKQGDEKQGDEKQGAGLFLQDLNGMDYGPNGRQGGKGFAVPSQIGPELGGRGPEPGAYRIIGQGVALGEVDDEKLEVLDLPIRAHQELAILDSCNMDGRKATAGTWFRNASDRRRPGALDPRYDEGLGSTDMILLMNPFPVSADAVEYNALSLQQYYFLTTSVLGNHSGLETKGHDSIRKYLDTEVERARISTLEKRMQTVEDHGFTNAEDIFCSLYPVLLSCNGSYCAGLKRYEYDRSLLRLDTVSFAFRSIDLIKAMLVELRHNRPVPREMTEALFASMLSQKVRAKNAFLMKTALSRNPRDMIRDGVIRPKLPIMNQILIQYFELLQVLMQAESLGLRYNFDPMRLLFIALIPEYKGWDEPAGKTLPLIKNLLPSLDIEKGNYVDYKEAHAFATAQGATNESLEAYMSRHIATWSHLLDLENKFLAAQAAPKLNPNTINPDVIPAFEALLTAMLQASQEQKQH